MELKEKISNLPSSPGAYLVLEKDGDCPRFTVSHNPAKNPDNLLPLQTNLTLKLPPGIGTA